MEYTYTTILYTQQEHNNRRISVMIQLIVHQLNTTMQ